MTGPEELDDKLAAFGAAWRADQSAPAEFDPVSVMVDARRWRPSRLMLAGSGTAVAAGLAALLIVTLGGGDTAGPAPVSAPQTSSAPTPSAAPTTEALQGTAATTWPDGVTTPECTKNDLAITTTTPFGTGQAGAGAIRVLLRNSSNQECVLMKAPVVTRGVTAEGAAVSVTPQVGTYIDQPSVLPDLLPGDTAAVNVEESLPEGECAARSPSTGQQLRSLTLTLVGGDVVLPIAFGTCTLSISGTFEQVAEATDSDSGWDPVSPVYGAQTYQRPCSAADLTFVGTGAAAALGNDLIRFAVRNVSTTGCALTGRPDLPSGTLRDGTTRSLRLSSGPTYIPDVQIGVPAELGPGQTGAFGLASESACQAAQAGLPVTDPYRSFEVRPPGGGMLTVSGDRDLEVDGRCPLALTSGWYAVERIPATHTAGYDGQAAWEPIVATPEPSPAAHPAG